MAKPCSICTHQERNAIDRALLGRVTLREIEGRFGVSKSALDRYRRQHVGPALANAIARHEELNAEKLASWIFASDARSTASTGAGLRAQRGDRRDDDRPFRPH